MAEKGDVEFMSDFALPLPMAVIGELVGVPSSDWSGLQPLVRAAARGIEPVLASEEIDAAIEAIGALGEYFFALLEDRRRSPRDDLLSSLVEAWENDDRLSDEEVASTAILLFAAGFETTTNLLGNGLLALLTHPDAAGRLARPPRHRANGRRGAAAVRQPGAIQPAHGARAGRPGR